MTHVSLAIERQANAIDYTLIPSHYLGLTNGNPCLYGIRVLCVRRILRFFSRKKRANREKNDINEKSRHLGINIKISV